MTTEVDRQIETQTEETEENKSKSRKSSLFRFTTEAELQGSGASW